MYLDGDLGDLGQHVVLAVAGQTINASADNKVGPELPRRAVEFIDVVLAIADVNDAGGIAFQHCRRAARILEPANALFCFDRHPGLIDFAFERQQRFELCMAPKPGRGQAEGEPFKRDGQSGMHHHAAQLMLAPAAFFFAPAVHIFGVAYAI